MLGIVANLEMMGLLPRTPHETHGCIMPSALTQKSAEVPARARKAIDDMEKCVTVGLLLRRSVHNGPCYNSVPRICIPQRADCTERTEPTQRVGYTFRRRAGGNDRSVSWRSKTNAFSERRWKCSKRNYETNFLGFS